MQIIALALGFVGLTGSLVAGSPTGVAAIITKVHDGAVWTFEPLPITDASNANERRANLDLSGDSCTSSCSGTAGQGPNEADCYSLIQQYWGRGTEKLDDAVPPHTTLKIVRGSCAILIGNGSGDSVQYQYNDLASVADYLRTACNGAHGYSQGLCKFDAHLDIAIGLVHN